MTMNVVQGSVRLHYLDNLRALAMLAGIFFHAALAYSPMMHNVWPSADAANHWGFDVFAWSSHLFRMPVFFMMAGFFAALLIQKRGGLAFSKNRLLRIALPLVLFLPILSVVTMWIIGDAVAHVTHKSPFLGYVQMMMTMPEPPQPPLSTMHLWFLYHLLFFYVLTYVLKTLLSHKVLDWLTGLNPLTLLLAMIISIVPALYMVSLPFPAPEWIFPALWALWFYGLFFALGYGFFSHAKLVLQFDPYRHYWLILGVLCFAAFYALLPESLIPEEYAPGAQPVGWLKLGMTALEASASVLLTLCTVLYAKRLLNFSSTVLRYISRVSYWVYVVHLPLLFWIQFHLLDLDWHMGIKFIVGTGATLLLSCLSFHLLVSWTSLSHLFVGNSSVKLSQAKPATQQGV
jgi:glucans biosynthesis protein C